MSLQIVIDQPIPGGSYHRQRIPIEGWVYADYRHERLKRISAHAPSGEIGATTHFFRREDVAQSLHLRTDVRTGFRMVATFEAYPVRSPTIGIELRAEFSDGSVTPLAGIHVSLLPNDYTGGPYGEFSNPQLTTLLRREQVYSVDPPVEPARQDFIRLLEDYLTPGASVIDVGCGVGTRCEPLRALGHSWIGCERSIDSLHQLALHSRPHRAIAVSRLPWVKFKLPAATHEFDAVICVDELARSPNPDLLLAEIARVTKHHAFISVPSVETLPFLAGRSVAPLHLLDQRQCNFFTRSNLRPLLQKHFRQVQVLDYGQQPLASPDGPALPYHLFALCEI
jgi:2-polyprenyl-3-methyl-5-hydroxy-6-metoxy-1,4-benzoquinol methylase